MYEIKELDNGRLLVGVPVEWTMTSEVPVLFENKEELAKHLFDLDLEEDIDSLEHDYVDGSFQVNHSFLKEMVLLYEKTQEE